MPAESKKQAVAARIALAAKKDKMPKSKLRGTAKEMEKSMTKSELKKFAKTRPNASLKAESFSITINNILKKLHFS